jgi:group I intron endonuclease
MNINITWNNLADKNLKMVVYRLDFPNGKVYIGQTATHLKNRINAHKHHLDRKTRLVNAILKYQSFTVSVIKQCDGYVELDECEVAMIKLFDSTDKSKGYNTTSGGQSNHTKEVPPEVGDKISQALKLRYSNPKNREKLKVAHSNRLGVKLTDETCKKISESHKQKIRCVELDMEFDSIIECAKYFGLSRQGLWKILKDKNGYSKKLNLNFVNYGRISQR